MNMMLMEPSSKIVKFMTIGLATFGSLGLCVDNSRFLLLLSTFYGLMFAKIKKKQKKKAGITEKGTLGIECSLQNIHVA